MRRLLDGEVQIIFVSTDDRCMSDVLAREVDTGFEVGVFGGSR
jgi:hypothetical protein